MHLRTLRKGTKHCWLINIAWLQERIDNGTFPIKEAYYVKYIAYNFGRTVNVMQTI